MAEQKRDASGREISVCSLFPRRPRHGHAMQDAQPDATSLPRSRTPSSCRTCSCCRRHSRPSSCPTVRSRPTCSPSCTRISRVLTMSAYCPASCLARTRASRQAHQNSPDLLGDQSGPLGHATNPHSFCRFLSSPSPRRLCAFCEDAFYRLTFVTGGVSC